MESKDLTMILSELVASMKRIENESQRVSKTITSVFGDCLGKHLVEPFVENIDAATVSVTKLITDVVDELS